MAITEDDIAKVLKLVSPHATLESLTETKDLDHLNKVSKNVVEKSIQKLLFYQWFSIVEERMAPFSVLEKIARRENDLLICRSEAPYVGQYSQQSEED